MFRRWRLKPDQFSTDAVVFASVNKKNWCFLRLAKKHKNWQLLEPEVVGNLDFLMVKGAILVGRRAKSSSVIFIDCTIPIPN